MSQPLPKGSPSVSLQKSLELYRKKRTTWLFMIILMVLVLVSSALFAMMFGSAGPFGPASTRNLTIVAVLQELGRNLLLPVIEFLKIPMDYTTSLSKVIVWDIRLPRILMGALAGMALAVAGTVMQALFRNPMADPYIIGLASGASVGASLAIVAGGSVLFLAGYTLPVFAFGGALITIVLVYRISNIHGTISVDTLLLSGITIGSFMAAMTSFLTYISGEYLRPIVFWLMGGLSLVEGDWEAVAIATLVIIPSCLLCLMFSKPLNLLLLGEETAQFRGLDVQQIQRLLLVLATLMTAVSVAFTGVIGFVGLIIPHLVRLITGPDHRILLPITALSGASFLILADVVAKTIIYPTELPVGIITAFCGAPFFLYLLRRYKRTRY